MFAEEILMKFGLIRVCLTVMVLIPSKQYEQGFSASLKWRSLIGTLIKDKIYPSLLGYSLSY